MIRAISESMAESSLSSAKVLLLAVQTATQADIRTLRALVANNQNTLRNDIVFRILLTYLPETLEPSEYVPFLLELILGSKLKETTSIIDTSSVNELSETSASKKARKLHLLPLAWPFAPQDAPEDPLILFLIHRAYKIDEETGLITQLPALLVPFLNKSTYLRTWMISTLLPLLRLNYEYHPQEGAVQTIKAFENLNDPAVVSLLLAGAVEDLEVETDGDKTIGRDLRGLVGPWMYGSTQRKRRKLRKWSVGATQTVEPLDIAVAPLDDKITGWEEVFDWIISQVAKSWNTVVRVIEQWDGPADVDLGGYDDGMKWLDENEQQVLKKKYVRCAIAAGYLIPEASVEALTGVQHILARIFEMLDHDRIPSLSAAAALLPPISHVDRSTLSSAMHAKQLRNGLMEESNILTSPVKASITLLHGLLISAFLLTRAGVPCSIRQAGELVLLQDVKQQTHQLNLLMLKVSNGPKGDDKFFIRMRNEILWLRDWGEQNLLEGTAFSEGRGVFGKIKTETLETEMLRALLVNTRYALARSIYETSSQKPLSDEHIHEIVLSAAMNAYDNATNANKTRGGIKKCSEILNAFPDTFRDSPDFVRAQHLVSVTHSIGQYRLVLKQGEPFTPIVLRIHADPISIIGKILDQNQKSYTKINELVGIGEQMVLAGLTMRDVGGHTIITQKQEAEQLSIANKRITSMCIDAALAEDDFETAYSYVMNRLSSVASEAQSRTPSLKRSDSGVFASTAPRILDDWSWKAALQAGKYRLNSNTVKPTHLGNASGNLEIRHLEQRMDCLSLALRIAPPNTLQDILNVWRRSEEELDAKIREEAAQEAAWDEEGDAKLMPGGFGVDAPENLSRAGAITGKAAPRTGDEAPMSLFDLARASGLHAQRSLSAATSMKGAPKEQDGAAQPVPFRKRDQLKNVAANTLGTGIGWLIGAPTQHQS